MIVVLTTFGVSVASALFPVINIEAYLVGLSASGAGDHRSVLLGVVAGLGQSVGKVGWYEASRRGFESAWMQRKLSGPKISAALERWRGRMQGRPWYGGLVVLVSAIVGVPPLLAIAAVAGILELPRWMFFPTVFVGRALRFWLILAGVDTALG